MNRKQFLWLVLALAVLGGAGWLLSKRDEASWSGAETSRVGQNLLKDFPVNDVAAIVMKNAKGELNLQRQNNQWQVKERGGYPASFSHIGDVLLKLQEMKITQSESITPAQRAALELAEPGKGEASGTSVEFKDQSGKTLTSLTLGKKYLRKGGANEQGFPAGRYVLVGSDAGNVAVVSDPLLDVEPKADMWISKEFVQVDKPKAVSVSDADGKLKWKVSREKEGADWQLADPKAGEAFDKVNGVSIANSIGAATFTDVVVDADPTKTGMDRPVVVTAETFDNLTYSMKIGKEGPDNTRHVTVAVAGEPNKQRTPGANEKPEDKEKLDKAFAEQVKKLEERVKREQALAKWTYLVPNWKVDPLLKERAQLMMEARKDEVKVNPAPEGSPDNPK